jgi:UDP-N-acetylmuramoyl-tripeptide--D-alanyl-D-alanine ligase
VAHGFQSGAVIKGFALDSREVEPGDLFLAIKGARVDGHDFVRDVLAKGALGSLVERPVEGPYILVPNLVEALASFGKSKRAEFDGPVIGITGSAGKTSTKEFVAAALSPLGPVLKNVGNRNTEYTSPLIWADLEPSHKAVVVEMSMRGFGQVAHLADIAQPNIGIVTNIGHAHAQMVGSREGIAKAKAELLQSLPPTAVSILWAEDEYLDTLRSYSAAPVQTFGFGNADCRITAYAPISWTECRVDGISGGQRWVAVLPSVGRHMALNAAAAIVAAQRAGVAVQDAADAMHDAVLPPMRMEVRHMNGATVILDTYNASPPSMLAAIETLAELPATGRRMAVIGEMRELGEESEEGHRAVGEALRKHQIDEILLVGPQTDVCKERGLDHARTAESLGDVTEFLKSLRPGDVVLVKGSRALELERAIEPLMETVA